MTSYTDCDELHLESLDMETLNYVLHGTIRQIDEAVEAAKAMHTPLAKAKEVAHGGQ